MRVERFPTPHFTPGREGHTPRGVVLHTTDGSFAGAVSWFADAASGVSAHYLVGLDGRIAWFVDEEDTARHAGRVLRASTGLVSGGDPNLYTVGIEFEDSGAPHTVARPDAQYTSGADLVAAIAARWHIPLDRDHVVGHREIFAGKTCPGNLDIDRVVREARA